jgi:hypothetical protein
VSELIQNPWLLLLHQVPPKPSYLRVKIWRRLQRLGAVAVKNAAYLLPNGEQAWEDFEWIAREIIDAGGDAVLCEVRFVGGLSDGAVEAMFREARDTDYAEVGEEARALAEALTDSSKSADRHADAAPQIDRLRKRLAEITSIDFFSAQLRAEAAAAIADLEAAMHIHEGGASGTPAGSKHVGTLRGRTWVTRAGVHVDRIASAWLIRQFVDPEARFRFVDGRTHTPEEGEIRFDMFEAEFTHEGDHCTFEVLTERAAPEDAALRAIAEIVHDVDLKDGKFGRPEAAGVERMIAGIQEGTPSDDERLARGAVLFEGLYRAFGGTR